MNTEDILKQFAKDMLDIYSCTMTVTDKCTMVSELPPHEWCVEVFWPDFQGIPIFGNRQSAMGREHKISLMEALISTGLCDSMGNARKAIRGNGIRVNRKIINDISRILTKEDALPNIDAIVLEFGKYHFGIIELC